MEESLFFGFKELRLTLFSVERGVFSFREGYRLLFVSEIKYFFLIKSIGEFRFNGF